MPPKKTKATTKRKTQSSTASVSVLSVEPATVLKHGEKVTFETLPPKIRDMIYRLHLFSEKKITVEQHFKNVGVEYPIYRYWCSDTKEAMPAIMKVSPKIEKEAARWYYAKNHFDGEAWKMARITPMRHFRLIQKFTIPWGDSTEFSKGIPQLHGLKELYIKVDEKDMIERTTLHSSMSCPIYHRDNGEPTKAQMTSILIHTGMIGIRKLYCIPYVEFVKLVDVNGKTIKGSGPLPNGLLNGQIRKFMMSDGTLDAKEWSLDSFTFLELTPELRNRIYTILFDQLEPIAPSNRIPTTAIAGRIRGKDAVKIPSCLSILQTCKQIHNEAYGIFYHVNSFAFKHMYELQAFLIMIGPDRKRQVRDLQFDYEKYEKGWVDMTDVTFSMLSDMTSLRRLRIDIKGGHGEYENLCTAPGMRRLFELRGITDIHVHDQSLHAEVERLKKQNNDSLALRELEKLVRVQNFFNNALQDAQSGRVNKKILEDVNWWREEPFPEYEEEPEQIEEEPSGTQPEEGEQNQPTEIDDKIVVGPSLSAAPQVNTRTLRPRDSLRQPQRFYRSHDDESASERQTLRRSKRSRDEADSEYEE